MSALLQGSVKKTVPIPVHKGSRLAEMHDNTSDVSWDACRHGSHCIATISKPF